MLIGIEDRVSGVIDVVEEANTDLETDVALEATYLRDGASDFKAPLNKT